MNQYFNFEIYTKNPTTGQTGWDIVNVSVKAENRQEAKISLNEYPNFDVIILFNFSHKEYENHDFLETFLYPNFEITNRLNKKPTIIN